MWKTIISNRTQYFRYYRNIFSPIHQ